jgi:predicted metal-dependent phosphoesterase TrpH
MATMVMGCLLLSGLSLQGFPAVSRLQTFDLQSHSTYSDGSLSPGEVVHRAAQAGVELLALTDHDTVDGVSAAVDAGRRHGVEIVPAVELSSVGAGVEDLHILGYGIDHTDPDLLATLHDFRQDRGRRIHAMADRLRELGFTIGEIEHESPGRPHLAEALLPQLPGMDRDEIFARYLVPGNPTYVGRERPTVEQAIEVIHRAGGVAVWAHPFWDLDEPPLDAFAGLDGVETFYITYSEEQTRSLYAAAIARGMLTTGSSDFHGPEHDRFNGFLAFETYGLAPNLNSPALAPSSEPR